MGIIFDIQRMSLHDGPGLRTSVFLKGCPLHCIWCHNPESHALRPQVFYKPDKCLKCGACGEICALHTVNAQEHLYARDECRACMKCVQACPAGALEQSGRELSVDETMAVLLRDRPFYEASGGGVTLSGGEVFAQFDFALALARRCKENGLHVAVETSGFAKTGQVEALAAYTDLFLYDIKETDPERHRAFTGVDNVLILQNLHRLNDMGKTVTLRCPIIPGCNDRMEHLRAVAELANSLPCVRQINVIPYHTLGNTKYDWLSREYSLKSTAMPDKDTVNGWISAMREYTRLPVDTP